MCRSRASNASAFLTDGGPSAFGDSKRIWQERVAERDAGAPHASSIAAIPLARPTHVVSVIERCSMIVSSKAIPGAAIPPGESMRKTDGRFGSASLRNRSFAIQTFAAASSIKPTTSKVRVWAKRSSSELSGVIASDGRGGGSVAQPAVVRRTAAATRAIVLTLSALRIANTTLIVKGNVLAPG
jgi:hypothetical protein